MNRMHRRNASPSIINVVNMGFNQQHESRNFNNTDAATGIYTNKTSLNIPKQQTAESA